MHDFHKILTLWYQQNKPNLPWRLNNEPYSVWVSEIILQQTRIDQGTDYYKRFLNRFPDIGSLANASEDEVLKVWQGLGYYSRARNMHYTAKKIVNELNSQFPNSYNEIRRLKGIGDYTAAAIASISFGSQNAAIDGNVYRVLTRIFGIENPVDTAKGKKEIFELADSLLDKQNPGQFNEALMEFGALQCIPQNPDCNQCPYKTVCLALKNNLVNHLPVKSKQAKQKTRYFNYLFILHQNHFFLEQRNAKDIWQKLYQLPLIETPQAVDEQMLSSLPEFISLFNGSEPIIESSEPEMIHLLTHQRLHIRFFHIRIIRLPKNHRWIMTEAQDIYKYPVPKPIEKYLSEKSNHQ